MLEKLQKRVHLSCDTFIEKCFIFPPFYYSINITIFNHRSRSLIYF